jgi:hypothetical protein
VIVMENKSPDEALAGTFTAGLARRYALLTNYHAVSHPSLPNYLALTSGSTWGIGDDNYHALPAGGIGKQLTDAGISWRAYMEGMQGDCRRNSGRYAVKHNPFAYYGGGCPRNVVAFDAFAADLSAGTPAFAWITPDLCNDTHDCSVATGDAWLAKVVPQVTATAAWRDGGLLLVTWDEGGGSDAGNRVATIVVTPQPRVHASAAQYDHYSLLATVEDRLGVGRLGKAAGAQTFDEVLGRA